MTLYFNTPLIQTPALSLHNAHVALPENPAQLLSMASFIHPLPLQVSLLSADTKAIAASSSVTLRFTVHSAPNGTKCICVATKPGATQLRVLLRGSRPSTLAWLNSCFVSEKLTVHAEDIEMGNELVISAPFIIRDINELLGLLREPTTLTEDHRRQGMAWLVHRLSSPLDLEQAAGSDVRRVLMCVEEAHALIPLMQTLGMQSSFGASPLQ